MVKSFTTSSCRIHLNFTNVNIHPCIFSHSYSDVLSKQSWTTEEGNTFSLGNIEATATQGIGDTIISGCRTCMTETNQKGCLDSGVIFSLYVYFIEVTIPLLLGQNYNFGTALHPEIVKLDLVLLKSIFFDSLK